ncbi:MAG: MBL fold metallo-hydrolase [Betaproteobacteria bacterium]|nr:MBL fold metallo-hydrolase [Betaproteobacteria bacterium]
MRFASLGSGSRGNALLVQAGKTTVLIDCGFGPRETRSRLHRLGVEPEFLNAILVTHEHSDHVSGLMGFARRHGVTVWMTAGTLAGLGSEAGEGARIEIFDSHTVFDIADLQVAPFPVPHDAREPVQFMLSDGRHRLGHLTDAGCTTPHIERMLSGCHALVLECNHDAELLEAGTYPRALKRRIAGRFGHLENSAARALLAALDRSRLNHVVAAHLSQSNNTPDLARSALAAAMGCEPEEIDVADQDTGLGWRDLA